MTGLFDSFPTSKLMTDVFKATIGAALALAVFVGAGPALARPDTKTAATPEAIGPWATCRVVFSNRDRETLASFRRIPVAVRDEQKHTGLNVRLRKDGVPMMLFVWLQPGFRPFWMKGVAMPLSVAYIGPKGRVLAVEPMEPDTSGYHWPPTPIIAALEAKTPILEDAGIVAGTKVTFHHCPRVKVRP